MMTATREAEALDESTCDACGAPGGNHPPEWRTPDDVRRLPNQRTAARFGMSWYVVPAVDPTGRVRVRTCGPGHLASGAALREVIEALREEGDLLV